MVIMARLLDPQDFGLFAMVLVVTGIYDLFSTAGLSTVTVQRETISHQQVSTLFWVNVLVGMVLALACLATAPALAALYHEERLFWIAVALSGGFLMTGAGVQHMALLQRELRYVTVAAIEIGAQVIAYAVGIAMALKGFSYWSLVAAAVAAPCLSTIFSWAAAGWVPGTAAQKCRDCLDASFWREPSRSTGWSCTSPTTLTNSSWAASGAPMLWASTAGPISSSTSRPRHSTRPLARWHSQLCPGCRTIPRASKAIS